MFNVDTTTGRITMHAGDTGSVIYTLSGYAFETGDKAVFTMKDKNGRIRKQAVLTPNADDEIQVEFEYTDTYRLPPDTYKYDIRVFQGATLDDDGNVTDGEYVDTPVDGMDIEILRTVGIE